MRDRHKYIDDKFTKQELISRDSRTIRLDPEEVALAIQVMDHDGDDVAYFGINGCFMYSKRTKGVLQ